MTYLASILPRNEKSPFQFPFSNKLLKRTRSRCPVCHKSCPAEVWRTGAFQAKVWLKLTCTEHDETTVCIAPEALFYWLAKGKAENDSGGPRPQERNSVWATPDVSAAQACRASDGSPAVSLGRNADPGAALGIQEKLSTCLALIEVV